MPQNIENTDLNNIEIRSDEVQELLGQVPGKIVRWGTTVIALTIAILIAGSALFKYPDILNANIVLTTQNPPVDLVSKINGKIDKLFVNDNQEVSKGDMIALLETAADYKDVLEADALSEKMMNNISTEEKKIYKNTKLDLGEIQSYFSAFLKEYLDYQNFLLPPEKN